MSEIRNILVRFHRAIRKNAVLTAIVHPIEIKIYCAVVHGRAISAVNNPPTCVICLSLLCQRHSLLCVA